jgi:short-subunit dehydrogenase
MHIVITGASSGLGEAMAKEFAKAGHTLTLIARRKDALDKLAATLGTQTHVVPLDLNDTGNATGWIPAAEKALGPIDVLISNAGSLTLGAVQDFDVAAGEAMFNLSTHTPIAMIRAVLPGMLQRGKGSIVNVTSIAAVVAIQGWAYQCASKAALASFSEALRADLRGTGVHVLTVYPGLTRTPMATAGLHQYQSKLVNLIPLGSPEKFAKRVHQGIRRKWVRLFYPRFFSFASWIPGISRWITMKIAPMPVR